MAIRPFLAMTAAEIRGAETLPPKTAWMACHFSPYSTGLSNLPKDLPPGSMVILDDITPIHGHDAEAIAAQLRLRLEEMECSGVLLDFQRPGYEESGLLAERLSEALPCPVGVSALYGQMLSCPVFLPPVPPDVSLADYLAPWNGREIWLELALDGETITLTPAGATTAPLPPAAQHAGGYRDEKLHCHYQIHTDADSARFTLFHTPEDLDALLTEGEALGVTRAVGLYQELHGIPQFLTAPE
jgi:hypothetical protein